MEQCNYNDSCMEEYCGSKLSCIKEMEPTCDSTAVIPSITLDSVDGITNLANCLVHVTSNNTTYYIDDKHRIMITWAGPVNIPGYDMVSNPNHYKNQIVTDTSAQEAVIYDGQGNGYMFGITQGGIQQAVNVKIDEMASDGTLGAIIATYIGDKVTFAFDTVADMKASEDLEANSYVKTLGYYSLNDGGGAYYKIDSTMPSGYYETLTSGLYAELIVESSMNVKQFGIKADGTTDNTAKLNTVLGLGKPTLYFPDGTYLINSQLTINNCKKIKGQSSSGTIIKAPNGFVTWDTDYKSYRVFSDFTVDGVSSTTNIGFEGALAFSKMNNINIINFGTAFKPLSGSWINRFDYITIMNCTNGISNSAVTTFNNNLFTSCNFQHLTTAYEISGDQNKFLSCDFEFCTTCFKNCAGRLLDIDNCYIEGNDGVFDINNPSFDGDIIVKSSWLYAKSTPTTGWLAKLTSTASPNTTTASLFIKDCEIRNISTSVKPIGFNGSDTKSYWGVSVENNEYFDVPHAYSGSEYLVCYDDLIDTSVCTAYHTVDNKKTFTSDLPLIIENGIAYFQHSLGNKRGAIRSNIYYRIVGHYSVTQAAGNIEITPSKKYACFYPQLENIPVTLRFSDNTLGVGRLAVGINTLTVIPEYNGKTVNEVIFDNTYSETF